MTKEEIIQSVKREFKGEFCYTALKVAMERYAKQSMKHFADWFDETGGSTFGELHSCKQLLEKFEEEKAAL